MTSQTVQNPTSSQADDLTLSPLAPTAEDELLAFYREYLPRGEDVARYCAWRRQRGNADGGVDPTVARQGGRLVGAVSSIRVTLQSSGRRVAGSWQVDSVVAPSMRGRGVGRRLVDAAAAPYVVAMANGTAPGMYRLRRRAGFEEVPGANYLVAIVGNRTRGSRRRRLAFPAVHALSAFRRVGRRAGELHRVTHFDGRFDDLAEAMVDAPEWTPVKTSAYLEWRYRDCPDREYLILAAPGTREPGGAVVVRMDHTRREGYLVDALYDPRNQALGHLLVGGALRVFSREGITAVWTLATSRPARRVLRAWGFLPTRRTPHFTFRSRDVDLRTGCNIWHGDGDAELY